MRVLHDYVAGYMAGDIVPDAPAGLVEIAEKGTINAATGQLLAEIVDDVSEEFHQLKQKAKELKIKGYANMKYETLKAAVESAMQAVNADAVQQPNPNN